MIIETERLFLRPFKDSDNEPYAQIGKNQHAMRFYQGIMNRTQCDANIARFKNALAIDGFGFLAAELKMSKKFIGIIGVSKVDEETNAALSGSENVEIGWMIHPHFWGQGLAPEGARACINYAWKNQKFAELVSFTAKINLPSQQVMKKIGMLLDPEGEFEHPKIDGDHPLSTHVLFRITNPHLPQLSAEYR